MFKSITTRLLTTFILITTVIIISMTLILSYVYKNEIIKSKKENLQSLALKANSLVKDYKNYEKTNEELTSAIDAMGYSSETVIYVVEIDKNSYNENKAKLDSGLNEKFIVDDLARVLDGHEVFRESEYSQDLDTNVLFMGSPLSYNGKVIGAVIMLCPISNIDKVVNKMYGISFSIAAAMILLSIPIIIFNSRRISKPIKQIGQAAIMISSGEKTDDIVIKSKDELGKLAESFNYMKDKIEKTEKMRNELIANVSHELRTPLTSISGFVQGMREGVIEAADYDEYLEIIQDETKRLICLVSDVLDMAKLQSGGKEMNIERLHLNSVVDSILSQLNIQALSKNINISVVIPDSLYVLADLSGLKQVLINVLNNSIKYTPNDGDIKICAKQGYDKVIITVRDNGIGISSEELPFIFEKFYRSDKVRNSEDKSIGLGLSIAKNIIELNDGTIKAQSTEGEGTVISIVLPFTK